MEYFDIVVAGSEAVYQRVDSSGAVDFLDASGNIVPAPEQPVRYILRSWCVNRPGWMEPIEPQA